MNTNASDVTFHVWQTFRTGLAAARRKALAIIGLALVSRFIASQVLDAINNFASTFSLSLASLASSASLDLIEAVFVFIISFPLMWAAIVPLTIQAIKAPTRMEASGTVVERLWRDVSLPYRAASLRAGVRIFELMLLNYALLGIFLLLDLAILDAFANAASWTIAVLTLIRACFGLLSSLVLLRWSLALPVMIMEDVPLRESLRRSWDITRSRVFRLLGLGMLMTAVVVGSSVLIGIVLILVFVLFPNTLAGGSNAPYELVFFIGQTVGLVFAAPITSACYYYLREN